VNWLYALVVVLALGVVVVLLVYWANVRLDREEAQKSKRRRKLL